MFAARASDDQRKRSREREPDRKVVKRPMVRWYNPKQLVRTGIDVALSVKLGDRLDFRSFEALQSDQYAFDHSTGEELWFDYVADLGDGWKSTFAVAACLARDGLRPAEDLPELPRGDLLVMGGDEVYPVGSRKEYSERLEGPYAEACKDIHPTPAPDLYAIPGNHDWYDGLASFMRQFCQGWEIGFWRTQQCRSYFALKLPRDWWLFAVDVKLGPDMDTAQTRYFEEQAKSFRPGTRVILATAVPDWIYDGKEKKPKSAVKRPGSLHELETNIIEENGGRIHVTIAGDLHHYRRHEKQGDESVQKITCGGGGAFLHPTHRPGVETLRIDRGKGVETYQFQSRPFPRKSTSWMLSFLTLLFPFLNPLFGIVTAAVYLVGHWVRPEDLPDFLMQPGALLWAAAVVTGFVLFADGKVYRIIAGVLHGAAHVAAAWFLSALFAEMGGWVADPALSVLATLGLVILGGFLAGLTIMGLYLCLSLDVFGQHPNEAFSASRVQGWKSFLRLHIRPDGKLEIYPIGLRSVSPGKTVPELIEGPIVIDPKPDAEQGA